MAELARKVESASTHLQVAWSDGRASSVERGLARRRRRRAVTRRGMVAVAMVGLLASGHAVWRRWDKYREPATIVVAHAPAPTIGDWKALAVDGEFDRAYRLLAASGPSAVPDVTADLLLAADVARLSHHPAQAVTPLEQVVRAHAGDPRAPLAAFTLGRVLLDELGRPAEAAQAFAGGEALDRAGPLAEDALAREVEAWSRAGDMRRASQCAAEYLRRYPDGRRLRSVRRYGGLD